MVQEDTGGDGQGMLACPDLAQLCGRPLPSREWCARWPLLVCFDTSWLVTELN